MEWDYEVLKGLIVRAYEVTGLVPVSAVIYAPGEGDKPARGCAIGALALAFECLDTSRIVTGTVVPGLRGIFPTRVQQSLAAGWDMGLHHMPKNLRHYSKRDAAFLAAYDAVQEISK